jgi:hypothetical protein
MYTFMDNKVLTVFERRLELVPGIKSPRKTPPVGPLETPGVIVVGALLQCLCGMSIKVEDVNVITQADNIPSSSLRHVFKCLAISDISINRFAVHCCSWTQGGLDFEVRSGTE